MSGTGSGSGSGVQVNVTTVVVETISNETVAQITSIDKELQKFSQFGDLCISCNIGLNHVSATFLWVTTLLFLLSAVVLLFVSTRKKTGYRLNTFIFFFIHVSYLLAYILMALSYGRTYDLQAQLVSDSGKIVLRMLYVPSNPPIFYARYIVWGIGQSGCVLLYCLLGKQTIEFTGLVSILQATSLFALGAATLNVTIPWILWFLSVVILLSVLLLINFYYSRKRIPQKFAFAFCNIRRVLSCWLLIYSPLWMLMEGTRTIGVDEEVIIFAMLDFGGVSGYTMICLWFEPHPEKPRPRNPAIHSMKASHVHHAKALRAAKAKNTQRTQPEAATATVAAASAAAIVPSMPRSPTLKSPFPSAAENKNWAEDGNTSSDFEISPELSSRRRKNQQVELSGLRTRAMFMSP